MDFRYASTERNRVVMNISKSRDKRERERERERGERGGARESSRKSKLRNLTGSIGPTVCSPGFEFLRKVLLFLRLSR